MYAPYLDRTDSLDQVMKRVKSLWTVAKNKYSIREQHDFKLALINPENMLRVPHCGELSAPALIRRADNKALILIRLNKLEIESRLELFISEVIPHDIAHIVCMFRPNEGHSHIHDAGWCKVCRQLGGTGLPSYV